MVFRFRFETLLGLRRNLEELARQKLARELAALDEQQQGLEALRGQRRNLVAEFEGKKHKVMPAPLFSFYMDVISARERDILSAQQQVDRQQQQVLEIRQELVERVRERKVLEKAREKDLQRFRQEQLKKEQTEADEQMVLRFGRHASLL